MPKYLICPGTVWANDGDIHFISAKKLIELYRVNPKDCIIHPAEHKARGWKRPEGLIELHPNSLGNYSIPENNKKGQ